MLRWAVGSIPRGGARCISVVRAFAHGAMGRRIDHSWAGARCSSVVRAFPHGAMGRRIDPSWWSEMYLRGKSVRSWCDGSSDRSLMVERDVAPW